MLFPFNTFIITVPLVFLAHLAFSLRIWDKNLAFLLHSPFCFFLFLPFPQGLIISLYVFFLQDKNKK
jgi:hypothetical protein